MLNKQHARAVVLSLRLKEISIIRRSIEAVPLNDISTVARFIPLTYLGTLLGAINGFLESTPHLEFLLEWCQVLSLKTIFSEDHQLLNFIATLIEESPLLKNRDTVLTRHCVCRRYVLPMEELFWPRISSYCLS